MSDGSHSGWRGGRRLEAAQFRGLGAPAAGSRVGRPSAGLRCWPDPDAPPAACLVSPLGCCRSAPAAVSLRESQCTDIQKQVRLPACLRLRLGRCGCGCGWIRRAPAQRLSAPAPAWAAAGQRLVGGRLGMGGCWRAESAVARRLPAHGVVGHCGLSWQPWRHPLTRPALPCPALAGA